MTTQRKPFQMFKQAAIIALLVTTASGCSVRVKNYVEIAQRAFETPDDVSLSVQEIKDYPYAAQYIRVDNRPRALMALAFDDENVLKWRTGGDEIIHTRHGRFIGSVNISGAIAHTDNLNDDPLVCLKRNLQEPSQCPTTWQRKVWITSATEKNLKDSVLTYSSEFAVLGTEQWTHPDTTELTVYKIEETSELFTNTFYLEQKTGRTVKSRQFVAPSTGYVEIEEVKPYANDLKAVNE
ncbi:YjbF family lipoprotein [Pseudidiomarina gelatinasegens]|uniref:YjbF family lipoprotein n=1 Tax=Pseudidiomarina gelatinasegens TaxID=2487740 RepID=UPI003A974DAD